MELLITLNKVNKTYNKYSKLKKHVLHDISLEINKNDFVCIMGSSGSGKTTLLNIISLIDDDYDGKLFYEGNDVKTINLKTVNKIKSKDIGFVFQTYNLLDNLTIKENIEFVLKLNNDKDKNKIMNISKKLGIDTILEKYPYECSGGQQQLSAIARALVVSPKIIFADEPTGNLDIKNTKRVMEILSKISEFSTVIIVTHDVNVAAYTKKVIYIEDGRIQDVLYKKSLSNSLFRKDIFNYIMNKRQ